MRVGAFVIARECSWAQDDGGTLRLSGVQIDKYFLAPPGKKRCTGCMDLATIADIFGGKRLPKRPNAALTAWHDGEPQYLVGSVVSADAAPGGDALVLRLEPSAASDAIAQASGVAGGVLTSCSLFLVGLCNGKMTEPPLYHTV